MTARTGKGSGRGGKGSGKGAGGKGSGQGVWRRGVVKVLGEKVVVRV